MMPSTDYSGKTYVYDILDGNWARKATWDFDVSIVGKMTFLYEVDGVVMSPNGYAFVEDAPDGQKWQLQDMVVGGNYRMHFVKRHLKN